MNPQAALRELGAAARGVRIIRPLHIAAVKRGFLAGRGRERFVLRIDHPLARELGLDRRAEARVLRATGRGGVSPELVACRSRAPAILLTRYAPGRAWTRADLDDGARLAELAALLRRVHAVDAAGTPSLDLARAAAAYARQSRGPLERSDVGATPVATHPDSNAALATQVGTLLARGHDPDAPLVLCHNDPIAANVIGHRRPLLIDWEYAARGDPLFDLAVVIEHHHMPARAARRFVAAYFGGAAAVPHERLAIFRAIYQRILRLWLAAVSRAGR